jgi:hypothetical protein
MGVSQHGTVEAVSLSRPNTRFDSTMATRACGVSLHRCSVNERRAPQHHAGVDEAQHVGAQVNAADLDHEITKKGTGTTQSWRASCVLRSLQFELLP